MKSDMPTELSQRRTAILSVLLGWSFFPLHQTVAMGKEAPAGQVCEFKVVRPDFVVTGKHLSKVEVWFWATGTGITRPALLGTATRRTRGRKCDIWALHIPPNLLATEIFVAAFDQAGKALPHKALPYKGAGEIYYALYGS